MLKRQEKIGNGIDMLNKICLDTSALIEIYRENPSIKVIVERYNEIYVTPITIFEFGKRKLTIHLIKEILENYLTLNIGYEDSILALKMFKDLVVSGNLIGDNDIIIGACCINNDIPLLTLNKKHFERLKKFGLRVV